MCNARAERVRVSAQLIDARSDAHLWAEHYDRDVADVFAIQSEIAQQIADQLQAKLSAAEKAAIAERPTADPVAYAFYTEAKEIDDVDDWEGAEKSGTETWNCSKRRRSAIRTLPSPIASSRKRIATSTHRLSDLKHLELAKKAAEAAVRVRPDLGETHLVLARYYFHAGSSPQVGPGPHW